ncbi:MAG: class I SAM-dependent methyltransferase [Candidatus Omnitrophica bacterium]|nr:class I SAM-dependent methyltransferase [Candidatus Omnitrophota bacterium]
MNLNCATFVLTSLKRAEVAGKRVLEAGSSSVNGSIRPFVEVYEPAEYIGVDISAGSGVDIVCDVNDIAARFGEHSFDVIISTELLEHVRDWRRAVHNMKAVCRPGGLIVITTRSAYFPYHGHPYDFWRYEIDDMERIFSDCKIEKIEKEDPGMGVFIRVRKPEHFIENDLAGYKLYSILARKRIAELGEKYTKGPCFRWAMIKLGIRKFLNRAGEFIYFKL